MAQAASTVICIVDNTAQVRDVVLGGVGIVEGAKEGNIFVCSTSIDLQIVKELQDILPVGGIKLLDAPVSGGVPRAIRANYPLSSVAMRRQWKFLGPISKRFRLRYFIWEGLVKVWL